MSDGDGTRFSAVDRCVKQLREVIGRGELQPGEHIRQAKLAEQLGVSRVPVREALKVLATEGIIQYEPNHGYYVAKMDAQEVAQLYTMRRLLETELLRNIQWPDADTLDELRELNEGMRRAAAEGDTPKVLQDNREFHFRILGLSPQRLILREVERLWSISDAYRTVYHYSHAGEDRIFREHDELLNGLASRDIEMCIYWSNRHRGQLEDYMSRMRGGTRRA
jgi:DNA-binding GntR family transcriptional regulator